MKNKKTRRFGNIIMISVVCIVGFAFLLLGIITYNSDMYPYDVYISENVSLYIAEDVENRYLIQGELRNKGSEAITIESLEFRCYNEDKSLHGTHTLENITINPGESYKIYEEILSTGEVQYKTVRLYKTLIDGEEVQLQYSKDGKSFSNKQNELTSIIAGAILLLIGGVMIFRGIRKRKVLNG